MWSEASPPARLVAGTCGVVAAMAARSPAGLLPVIVLILAGLAITRTAWVTVVQSWWRFWFLLGVAFVGGVAGEGAEGATVPLVGVVVTNHGLLRGLFLAAKLALAVASVRVYLWMREPGDVAHAVSWWLSPVERFGANPRKVGDALGLTMTLLPVLTAEIGSRVRGLKLRFGELGRALAVAVQHTTDTRVDLAEHLQAPRRSAFSAKAGALIVVLGVAALVISLLPW